MGYHQFVKDAARGAEDGEFTAPSMEDYARHRYPDQPLQLEDKNIIFAGGPVPDEGQQGKAPQFERGKTKAQRRLDRFEERVGSRHKPPALPNRALKSGEITPPDALSDVAKSGNGELYMRRNGQPFPSEGLAKLSKPYSEAKKAGEKPKVVEVDGGYAVEMPPSDNAPKNPIPPKPAEKPVPEPPPKAPEKKRSQRPLRKRLNLNPFETKKAC